MLKPTEQAFIIMHAGATLCTYYKAKISLGVVGTNKLKAQGNLVKIMHTFESILKGVQMTERWIISRWKIEIATQRTQVPAFYSF